MKPTIPDIEELARDTQHATGLAYWGKRKKRFNDNPQKFDQRPMTYSNGEWQHIPFEDNDDGYETAFRVAKGLPDGPR